MGACCTKFGTYFVKKEEAKSGHGDSPKLNKVELKSSFVADKVKPGSSFFNRGSGQKLGEFSPFGLTGFFIQFLKIYTKHFIHVYITYV
jgi:hypothetical protein